MEKGTPRTLIKGVLKTSKATRKSPRWIQTPSLVGPVNTQRSVRSLSQRSSIQPSSSDNMSGSVKRSARGSLTNQVKRRKRTVASTPSEIITPRANIRAYLGAAETPAERSETATSRLSRSAVSDRQVERLKASESRPRRTSPRKRFNRSYPTPKETMTPREAIKQYLNAADTVPRTSTPKRTNIRHAESESSEEKEYDSESAAADDEQSQEDSESGNKRGESRVERAESGEERAESEEERTESGEERVESEEERAESEEERVESEEERAESGEERAESRDERAESGDEKANELGMAISAESHDENVQTEHSHEIHASPAYKNKYESSHEATGHSSEDYDQEVAGGLQREQDSLNQELTSQDEQEIENQRPMQSQENESVRKKNDRSRNSGEWGKLRTPVLPDTTTVRATPVVLGKPPIPLSIPRKKKASNLKKFSGKENQAKKSTRKASPVLRLPSSLVSGIFRHFSALRVSKDALDAVQAGSDKFFENVVMDLTSYCNHARRKTLEESDVELLMRRQGLVKSRESFYALIEKYLPMEYKQEIIPTAKSGNKVVPKAKI